MAEVITLDPTQNQQQTLTKQINDLFRFTPTPHSNETKKLYDVTEDVYNVRRALDPKDLERPLCQFKPTLTDRGRLNLGLITEHGVGEGMSLTKWAANQWAGQVLPTRGLNFLEKLLQFGPSGRQLAELNATLFSTQKVDPSFVRTIEHGGERSVRAVLSQRYATVDDVDVLGALLGAEETKGLPVCYLKISDTGFHMRMWLDPDETFMFGGGGHEFIRTKMPMIEVRNSEVGRCAVTMTGGMIDSACTNMHISWGDKVNYRWIHSGSSRGSDRIKNGISEAVRASRVVASQVAQKYIKAAQTEVADMYALIDQWLPAVSNNATKYIVEETKKALTDPTTLQNHSLASIADAVTLAAQKISDDFDRRAIEVAAAKVVDKGLNYAARNNGRIDIQEAV
jgi:hypothetical protein